MSEGLNRNRLAAAALAASLSVALALPATVQAAPAQAASTTKRAVPAKKPKQKVASETDAVADKLRPGTLGSFTPSIVDPSRALVAPARGAATARAQTLERSFRFTPSGKINDRKALSVGVTSRVVTASAADGTRATSAADPFAPSGYNVGLSVGYYGFSLSGGYSRFNSGLEPLREGVDLGLSYRGKGWKTSLQVAGEEASGLALDPLGLDKRYSIELGGAYALTPRLSLSGGVRYRLTDPTDPAGRLDSQHHDSSIYLGTAFSF